MQPENTDWRFELFDQLSKEKKAEAMACLVDDGFNAPLSPVNPYEDDYTAKKIEESGVVVFPREPGQVIHATTRDKDTSEAYGRDNESILVGYDVIDERGEMESVEDDNEISIPVTTDALRKVISVIDRKRPIRVSSRLGKMTRLSRR